MKQPTYDIHYFGWTMNGTVQIWSNMDANRSVQSAASVKSMDCLVQNFVCVVVVVWTQSNCWIYGINVAVQCNGCISFRVVSCYLTIKVLEKRCCNLLSPIYIDFVTALKKLIIISKENYLFQSAYFIGTWNLWKCKFILGIVLHFEIVLCMRQLKLQSVTSRLTKTMHHCPKKILTHVKFTVHIWTYLEKQENLFEL